MPTTRVLILLAQTDGRRSNLQKKAKELRACLNEHTYRVSTSFSEIIDEYLDVVRSTLRRPMLLFKRNLKEIMTNTIIHPFIAVQANSNTDIQFVLMTTVALLTL